MATKIFLADIDLSKNQLLNARLENRPSAPSVYAPSSINDPDIDKDLGLLYWNTTDKTAYFLSGYNATTLTPEWKSLGGTGSGVLTGPVTVSIGAGKWFGKYSGGTTHTVGEAGMTIENFLRDVALESMPPTANLSLGSNSIPFNPSSVTNVVTFSGAATTPGATVTSTLLEYQRGSGSWETLNVISPYSHVIPLGLNSDRTSSFNYRLTITDSNNQIRVVSTTASIAGKQAPTITGVQSTTTVERGDLQIGSSVTLNRNTASVTFVSYRLYAKVDGGAEVLIGNDVTSIEGNPSTQSISFNIENVGTINGTAIPGIKDAATLNLYARVIDTYTNSAGTVINTTTNLPVFTRNYELKKFIGAKESAVSNYRTLTILPGSTTTYNFNPNPGRFHVIALPSGKTLTSVTTSNNETLTTNFVLSSEQIPDAGGTNRTYNVYKYSPPAAFSPTVTFYITVQA